MHWLKGASHGSWISNVRAHILKRSKLDGIGWSRFLTDSVSNSPLDFMLRIREFDSGTRLHTGCHSKMAICFYLGLLMQHWSIVDSSRKENGAWFMLLLAELESLQSRLQRVNIQDLWDLAPVFVSSRPHIIGYWSTFQSTLPTL